MKCRKIIAGAFIATGALLTGLNVKAQDVHFTQFNATPMTINPAFTGAFQGDYRVSAIYRDQWREAIGVAAFKTIAVSFDMPVIKDISIDDYLAVGAQLYNDRAGEGNLNNFSALGSIAYHKFFGESGTAALTVGLQAGYANKNIDLSKLYFAGDFNNGGFVQGLDPMYNNLTTRTGSFLMNAGAAFSYAATEKFSFVIGAGANNLTQPLESFQKQRATKDVGLGIRYTGQLGADIGIGERFHLRPAILAQSQSNALELIGGAELLYKLGDDYTTPDAPSVFVGGWYRHLDAAMITAGVEFNNFRIGAAYDLNTSGLKQSTNGYGGMELMIQYIQPSPLQFARRLLYPCARF
ncbi:MAG TPA: PorP/SprF family type IX secretion system membrane protein [Edaphocola sp.]|nr:PorP/SprF family type IX secretion system membrane protein [Edaphocola sp.]